MRFLGLKTKSDIAIKSKAIKILLKNIAQLWIKSSDFSLYQNNGNILCEL